jgi:hypothetical protein
MSFARGLPSYKKELCQQEYRVITFKLTNFMDYIQIKNNNQYQREQVKNFFYDIQQSNQFASQFSERVFQSSAVFPFIRVEQENDTYGALIIYVAIVKELYFYSYPFYFPRYFQTYNSVYDLQVKLQIIYSYSQNNLKKKFDIKAFLDRFKKLKNQKQTNIKKLILKGFNELNKMESIQGTVEIEFKNGTVEELEIHKITPLQIGKVKNIFYHVAL